MIADAAAVLLLLPPDWHVCVCWPALRTTVHNGHIKRITDEEIQSSVLEIMSSNVSTTFITCPADPQKTLGIKLPFLVMIVKVRRACVVVCCKLATHKGTASRLLLVH
jgi:hypothetical protein